MGEVQGDRAVFKVHINATMEEVWHELTKTDEVQKAMYNCRMHTTGLGPGGAYQMRTPNGKHTMVLGEILEIDPPRYLKQTFRFAQYDDPPCTLIYELKEASQGGVDFSLVIENLPEGTKTAKGMLQGGDFICKNLKSILETGKPPLATRMMYVMFGLLGAFLPKRTRVENWPLKG